ncbi:MAG: DUF4143 domain-containing protein [Coriobacteriia bacterium]|nr:DUF4143 domain-containing protein [Coriobacteriia bacterium]
MKRKIYRDLLDWKNNGASKPLLVTGARQVGKTYIIESFCQSEFSNYLEFNLLDRADIVSLFKEAINTQEKIDRLELLVGHKIDFENTVIFFDEVQVSEEVIAACKFFAESKVAYKIICAGSLLGVKINRFTQSFPVGKVRMLSMFPLDFEEFLWANGHRLLVDQIKACFSEDRQMASALHERLLRLYRQYLYIGGMPEAVMDFVGKDKDVLLFDTKILDDIRIAYISDMGRYAKSPLESTRIEAVYSSVSGQLLNVSKKFMYSKVRKGSRSRDYASPLEWLVSSGMLYRSAMVEKPLMPLKSYEKEGFFKLYLSDPGLLCNALGIRPSAIMLDQDFTYKGVLAENYVAGQLVAAGHRLCYWRSENTAEIDFLLSRDEGIIPFEVKAGKRVGSPSLRAYQEKFAPPFAIRLSTKNFAFSTGIKAVPLYATFCL